MSELYETAATLRFFGDDLEPDEVTALLGQPPTHSARKGDILSSRSGVEYRHRSGSWRRQVANRTPGDLDSQISELLSGLTDDLAVWASLAARFKADLFCGLFMQDGNEGLLISPETLAALGQRRLTLDLDIYDREANSP